MYYIARIISIWGVNKNFYSSQDIDVVRYGLEVLLSQLITFFPIIIYMMYAKNKVSIVFMVIVFSALRVTSNGYHAKTFLSCFLITNTVLFIGIIIIPIVYPSRIIAAVLLLMIAIRVIYLFIEGSYMSIKQKVNKLLLLFICSTCLIANLLFCNNVTLSIIQYVILISYGFSNEY